jgi:hypothetical protein
LLESQAAKHTEEAATQTSKSTSNDEELQASLCTELARAAEALEQQAAQLQRERQEAQSEVAAAEIAAAERVNEIGEAAETAVKASRCVGLQLYHSRAEYWTASLHDDLARAAEALEQQAARLQRESTKSGKPKRLL